MARCVSLQRPVVSRCPQPRVLGASGLRTSCRSSYGYRPGTDEAATLQLLQATASPRRSVAAQAGGNGAGTATEVPQADNEHQASAVEVPAAGDEAPATAAPGRELGAARSTSLEQEVTELRLLLQQQAEQQAEAVRLIQQQQQTIATLERRLLGGDTGGGPFAAASSTAAPASPSDAAPLDGPAFVMQPSVLERPVQGECRHVRVHGCPSELPSGRSDGVHSVCICPAESLQRLQFTWVCGQLATGLWPNISRTCRRIRAGHAQPQLDQLVRPAAVL